MGEAPTPQKKWLSPICTKLGWRSDLALQDIVKQTGVVVDYRYKLESIDLWETVVISNNKSTQRVTTQDNENSPAIETRVFLPKAHRYAVGPTA